MTIREEILDDLAFWPEGQAEIRRLYALEAAAHRMVGAVVLWSGAPDYDDAIGGVHDATAALRTVLSEVEAKRPLNLSRDPDTSALLAALMDDEVIDTLPATVRRALDAFLPSAEDVYGILGKRP